MKKWEYDMVIARKLLKKPDEESLQFKSFWLEAINNLQDMGLEIMSWRTTFRQDPELSSILFYVKREISVTSEPSRPNTYVEDDGGGHHGH